MEPQDEAEILFPQRKIAVGGREVEVAELTFWQSLQLGPALAGLVAGLAALLKSAAPGEIPGVADLFALFSAHADATLAFLAAVSGLEPEEIKRLPEEEGALLLLTAWNVNTPFFLRRLEWLKANGILASHEEPVKAGLSD